MGLVKILQGLAGASNLIYLLGWILALIGLAYQQNWCKDHVDEASLWTQLGLTAVAVGSQCNKLFRFAWFVWAFSSLPLFLSVMHNIKPHLVPRGSGPLFAIAAVLQILMANEFFNLDDYVRETGTGKSNVDGVSDTISTNDTVRDWVRVTVAGFAILAIAALLTIIFEAVTDPSKSRSEHSNSPSGGRHSKSLSGDRRDRGGSDHVKPRMSRDTHESRAPTGGRVADAVPVVEAVPVVVRNEPVIGQGVRTGPADARYV